ncbi:MAG: enoyl-CoA hydratase/isomerase family protein [Dehalococcoidia bacterium]|jgi:2-(1,2-epoxy-1,2-dihydrophenyl)acetyl-CoA isomerase|nr:enoyl-CoA hydratase/isomerase family protein [Dehalococcoidia bacterium]
MTYDELTVERTGEGGHVGLITLNRPEKLNALNRDLQNEQRAAFAELGDDDDVRAIVVTGAGRGFCSGADLTSGTGPNEGVAPQNERLDEMGWVGKQAMSIYNLTKPTIAAVNGAAAGAGMSLALACDMRVGSENTRFKTVFLERSLSPDSGMSFFLPRIVGYSRATDLIFSSRNVDADEAYRIGLLDRLGSADTLIDDAVALADQISFWPPVAMRSAKRVIQHNLNVGLEEALRYETLGLNFARRAPHDVQESRLSFSERRPPQFTGE